MTNLHAKISNLLPSSLNFLAKLTYENSDSGDNLLNNQNKHKAGPLSPAQERLWFVEQLYPNSSAYHLPLMINLDKLYAQAVLNNAINALSMRHDALRTRVSVETAQPWQWVEEEPLTCEIKELGSSSHLDDQINQYISLPFNFEARLSRCALFNHPQRTCLVVVIHHLLADGWSMQILMQELMQILEAYDKGLKDISLPELKTSPCDIANWQRQELKTANQLESMKYWNGILKDAPTITTLPTDFPRPRIESRNGTSYSLRLDSDITACLDDLVHSLKTTRFNVLFAAFSSMVSILSGHQDHVIGTPFARRDRPELRNIVAFLVEMLPLRIKSSQSDNLIDLTKQISQSLTDAVTHSNVSLQELVENHVETRSLAFSPLFQIVFAYQDLNEDPMVAAPQPLAESFDSCEAKFEVCMSLRSAGSEALDMNWEYRSELFTNETIHSWAILYKQILQVWLKAPQTTTTQLLATLTPNKINGMHNEIAYPIHIHDHYSAKLVARNNEDQQLLATLSEVLNDNIASSELAFDLSGEVLRCCAQAWVKKLNLPQGARIGSCNDKEARTLAACVALTCNGSWQELSEDCDLIVVRAGSPHPHTLPRIIISWLFDSTISDVSIDNDDTNTAEYITWPLASGCLWSVEAEQYKGKPIWPTAYPITSQLDFAICRNGNPVPTGAIGQLHTTSQTVTTTPLARKLCNGQIQLISPNNSIKVRGLNSWPALLQDWLVQQPNLKEAKLTEKDHNLVLTLPKTARFDTLSLEKHIGDKLGEPFRPSVLSNQQSSQENVKPTTDVADDPITAVVWRTWKEVLKNQNLGLDDDFFANGGSSITALEMLALQQTRLGKSVSLHSIFEAPTVRQMADIIRNLCLGKNADQLQDDTNSDNGLLTTIAALAPEDVKHWCHTLTEIQIEEALTLLLAGSVSPQTYSTELLEYVVKAKISGSRLLPASQQQTRLWFAEQLQPNIPTQHLPVVLLFNDDIEDIHLERALNAIIARHEALRTKFTLVRGGLWQQILSSATIKLTTHCESSAPQSFALEDAPLLRADLYSDDKRKLLLTFHHIIVDGWSIKIIRDELFKAYNQALVGEIDLGAAPAQASEFVIEQCQKVLTGTYDKSLSEWKKHLVEVEQSSDVPMWPSDRTRANVSTQNATASSWWIDKHTTAKLEKIAADQQTSLFQVLAMAVGILSNQLTGRELIVIGSPIAQRATANSQSAVAYLVDIQPSIIDLRNDPSIEQVLSRSRALTKELPAVPFVLLAKELGQSGLRNRHAIIETSLSLQEQGLIGETQIQAIPDGSTTNTFSAFDVDITLVQTGEGKLRMVFTTSDDLFETQTNHMLALQFRSLLNELTDSKALVSLLQKDHVAPVYRAVETAKLLDHLTNYSKSKRKFNEKQSYAQIRKHSKQLCVQLQKNRIINAEIADAVALFAAAHQLDASIQLKGNKITATLELTGVPATQWVINAKQLASTLGWKSTLKHPMPVGDTAFVVSSLLAIAWSGGQISPKDTTNTLKADSDSNNIIIQPQPSWRENTAAIFLEQFGGYGGSILFKKQGEIVWTPHPELQVNINNIHSVKPQIAMGTLQLMTEAGPVNTKLKGWSFNNAIHLYDLTGKAIYTADGPLDHQLAQYFCQEIPGVASVKIKQNTIYIKTNKGWHLEANAVQKSLCKSLGAAYRAIEIQINSNIKTNNKEPIRPSTPLELSIARHWQQILNTTTEDIEKSFFEDGGSSLEAILLLEQLKERLNLDINLANFFAAPTIKAVAEHHLGETNDYSQKDQEQDLYLNKPTIRPNPDLHQGPLSFGQERMWFLTQLFPKSTVHNMLMVFEFEPTISQTQIEQALQKLTQRHAVLRSRIISVAGVPMQIIKNPTTIKLPVKNIAPLEPNSQQEFIRQYTDEMVARPIDLQQQTWFAEWINMGSSGNALLLVIHHIVTDGWSNAILRRDLLALSSVTETEQELSTIPISYADYCRWQRTWFSGGHGLVSQALATRTKRLEGAPPLINLPWDNPRPESPTQAGAIQQLSINQQQKDQITELSKQLNVTPFALITAAFACVLSRWSGEKDIILGTPSHQRNSVNGITDIIGFFVNTLVMRIPIDVEAKFTDVVENSAKELREVLAADQLPFEQLVNSLKASRDIGYNPIFQVMIAWQEFTETAHNLGKYEDPSQSIATTSAHFDLTLYIHPTNCGYQAVMEYSTELFNHDTITALLLRFRYFLNAAIANSEQQIQFIPLAEPNSQIQQPQYNPIAPSLQSRIVNLASEQPTLPALRENDTILNYSELVNEAAAIAMTLHQAGVKSKDRVAVYMQPGIDASVIFLAIMWAGACYVPIDTSYPDERCRFICQDAKPTLIVSKSKPNWHSDNDCPWLPPKRDDEKLDIYNSGSADELYIVYTSGSTGRPKGVVVSQAVIQTLTQWHTGEHRGYTMRTGQFAPNGFDVSIQEHIVTWLSAGCLLTTSNELRRDPEKYIDFIHQMKVQRLFLPYVALQQMCTAIGSNKLPELKEVVTAGEQLRITPMIREFFINNPNARLFNQYGPSETHVVTEYTLPQDPQTWPTLPPIGKTVGGATIQIVEQSGVEAPIGIVGEIWVGGHALADGYLNREKDVKDKFVKRKDGSRWYRTGDYARIDKDGLMFYLGRRDDQIKVRGYRIELGEIESSISQLIGVEEAAVSVRQIQDTHQIISYICPDDGPSPEKIKQQLSKTLPSYMLPSHIICLKNMPKTASGKIARSQLPQPNSILFNQDTSANSHQDLTPLEQCIAELWSKYLAIQNINAESNFFELGGQSLLVTKFVSELKTIVGFNSPPWLLFRHPNLSKFTTAFIDHIINELGDFGTSYIEQVCKYDQQSDLKSQH